MYVSTFLNTQLTLLHSVVGYEIAGVVDRVGFGVSETGDAWLGREVVAFTRFKGYADTVCVPVEFVFTKPAALSFVEAASLPVTYATVGRTSVAAQSVRVAWAIQNIANIC